MDNSQLIKKRCVPCEGGAVPLSKIDVENLLAGLTGWALLGDRIEKDYLFRDFSAAMGFVNSVARTAESEGHHPDILIRYNQVKISLWTYAISALSENDFILAAKIDQIIGSKGSV